MVKDVKCSICGRKFKKGFKTKVVSYIDKQTFFKKRWYIGKKCETVYICDQCRNCIGVLVRNNLAFRTSDIIDE